MNWTEAEEKIVAHIMATETMHDPDNSTGDVRIQCTRSEALRRMRRRTRAGQYQEPTKPWVLADIHLPVTPRLELTPEHLAALTAGRERFRLAEQTL